MKPKSIITLFGTDEEKEAMQEIRNAIAGKRDLSWTDFILEHFGVRKTPKSDTQQ